MDVGVSLKLLVNFPIAIFFWQKQLLQVFYKKVFWKNSKNSQKNTCFGASFVITLHVSKIFLTLEMPYLTSLVLKS